MWDYCSRLTGNIFVGPLSSRETAPHPNEVGWSNANLPDILFQLEPSDNWGKEPLQNLLNQNGQLIMNNNRVSKDFDLLPTHISIDPEDFRLEMWRDRTHPAVETHDLLLRMHPDQGESCLGQIAMNQRCIRFRKRLGIMCWTRQTKTPSITDCLLLEQLSEESIKRNTVLPVMEQGLLKPCLAPDGSRYGSQYIPGNTFTDGSIDHKPSQRLSIHLDVVKALQQKACELRCPHWIFLPNKHKPEAWIKKASSQEKARKNSGQRCSDRTSPDDVMVPAMVDITPAALEYIKNSVQLAASFGNPLDVSALSKETRAWVEPCINQSLFDLGAFGSIDPGNIGDQDEGGIASSMDKGFLQNIASNMYCDPQTITVSNSDGSVSNDFIL